MSSRPKRAYLYLALALGAGLVHGLVYLFLVPPWQHNDEPSHFAYAWMCAHANCLSRISNTDPGMSRAVVQSMVKHHFYNGVGAAPDLTSGTPVSIGGYEQYSDPPLYYLLASLPIRIVTGVAPQASVDIQLYTVRFVSILFLLIVILASWGVARELVVETSSILLLLPLTLALWPGFVDLMTAVTNIAGAVAFFSLLLWSSVRLIRRGFGWLEATTLVVASAACLWTSRIVFVALPLAAVAMLFAVFRRQLRWIAWVILASGLLIGLLFSLSWGDADLWYREAWQAGNTRTRSNKAPVGEHALQLFIPAEGDVSRLSQLIPPPEARLMANNTITVGAWMWAAQPVRINSPILQMEDGYIQYTSVFTVTETPAFFAITATLGAETGRSWVTLSLPPSTMDGGVAVYYDGVVLADGKYPVDEPPVFNGSNAEGGTWGGRSFTNLVRNPSAEISGLRIRSWVDHILLFGNFGRPSLVWYAFRDWPGTGWYFRGAIANVFRTVWGRFGWNHVSFLGHKPYRVFLAATIIGLLGALYTLWHSRKRIPWNILAWLGLAGVSVGVITILRGIFLLWWVSFMPSARYIYPVMVVIALIFSSGWLTLLRIATKRLRPWAADVIYGALFLVIDGYAFISIIHYYYR